MIKIRFELKIGYIILCVMQRLTELSVIGLSYIGQ